MVALKLDVSITANAIAGRDLNGQSSARFAITNIPRFDVLIAAASVPTALVHTYITKWYKGICVSELAYD